MNAVALWRRSAAIVPLVACMIAGCGAKKEELRPRAQTNDTLQQQATAQKAKSVQELVPAQPDSVKEIMPRPPAAPHKVMVPQATKVAERALPISTGKSDSPSDALIIEARLVEIPGPFPPNDLYNYVYIMKYRVLKVLQGTYANTEILVGHYNPLLPRHAIKDKMTGHVSGNIEKFTVGDVHRLVCITPIDKVWKDAVEDSYFDATEEKYFALRADMVR